MGMISNGQYTEELGILVTLNAMFWFTVVYLLIFVGLGFNWVDFNYVNWFSFKW